MAADPGILAGATWVGFGALVGMLMPHVTWQIVAYAALSLTLIRMVPVAIAMRGTGARLPTVAFMGWFGPRGGARGGTPEYFRGGAHDHVPAPASPGAAGDRTGGAEGE